MLIPAGGGIEKPPFGPISRPTSGDQSIAAVAGSNSERPLWPSSVNWPSGTLRSTAVVRVAGAEGRRPAAHGVYLLLGTWCAIDRCGEGYYSNGQCSQLGWARRVGNGLLCQVPRLGANKEGVRQSSNRGSNRYGSGSWMVTAANSGCSGLRIMLVSAGATADGTISPTL